MENENQKPAHSSGPAPTHGFGMLALPRPGSSPCAAVAWGMGTRGQPVATRMTRSSPPRPGHCGEVARQGGATRSSPQQQVDGEGGGVASAAAFR
jgi:hypothetical protein